MTVEAPPRSTLRAEAIIRGVAERAEVLTRPGQPTPRHLIAQEAHAYVKNCSVEALRVLQNARIRADRGWLVHWPGDGNERERLDAFVVVCTAAQRILRIVRPQ